MRRRTARGVREKRALIALSLVPGVGSARVRRLVMKFERAELALAAPERALASIAGIGAQTAAAIARFDGEAEVDEQVRRAIQTEARMVTSWDNNFPTILQEIYDPPAFFWVKGTLRAEEQAISIVGTRRPSDYGRRTAHTLARELAAIGFTIVSGLAYGIDAAAHKGALEAGGRTIAVLGSGIDRIYPARNASLARDIIERGAVVSEFPMGTKPDAGNFPRRNRLVSGLSRGTLVVEAFQDGGALITARLALEQNREVFAIPGSIMSKSSEGTNRLIQQGQAKLVQNIDDILDELDFEGPSGAAVKTPTLSLADLTPEERALCGALGTDTLHIDRLCVASGLDPSEALVHLLNLEFKGVVRQLAGKQFFLARPLA